MLWDIQPHEKEVAPISPRNGTLVGTSKLDRSGRVVLPKAIKEVLGVNNGDRILFFFSGGICNMKSLEQFSIEASHHAGLIMVGPDRKTYFDTRRMAILMGINMKAFVAIVGCDEEQLDAPDNEITERIWSIYKLIMKLRESLGSWVKVRQWLHYPKDSFDGEAPIDWLLLRRGWKFDDFLI